MWPYVTYVRVLKSESLRDLKCMVSTEMQIGLLFRASIDLLTCTGETLSNKKTSRRLQVSPVVHLTMSNHVITVSAWVRHQRSTALQLLVDTCSIYTVEVDVRTTDPTAQCISMFIATWHNDRRFDPLHRQSWRSSLPKRIGWGPCL